MDTLKSLAVITLLGAVLYGVYVVASKPEKSLSPEMEAMASVEGPMIDDGHAQGHSSLSPPILESPARSADNKQALKEWATSGTSKKSVMERGDSPSAYEATSEARADFTPPPDPLTSREAPGTIRKISREVPVDNASPTASDRLDELKIGSGRSSAISDEEIEASKRRVQRYAFKQTWEAAQQQVSEDRHREALLALSAFYNDSALTEQEREELVGWLDALAAKVVYSTEHLLEPAYEVRRSESLYQVANRYQVPFLLLKNINGVRDPEVMTTGTKLKVLKGPFHAEVDLTRQEITLFVQNLYAGRFPCALGSEPVPPGEYTLLVKTQQKEYRAPQGTLAATDPRNPYGGMFLDLGRGVSIHGSPAEAYADPKFGCISLAPRDAEDLFSILSLKESKVVVRE